MSYACRASPWLAYPFRPHAKTAADRTQKRSFMTKPKAIQPPPLLNQKTILGTGSIFADRYEIYKTSPKRTNNFQKNPRLAAMITHS
jgi:hypothetical protein